MDYKEDIRIQKTRRDLRNAILDLILKQPIEKISVKEICDEAMVNRMTFYKYYEDKYQLLDDLFFEIKSKLWIEDKSKPKTIDEIIKFIRKVFKGLINFLEENRELVKALKDNGNNQLFEMIVKVTENSFCELFAEIDSIKKLKYPIPVTASFFCGGLMAIINYGIEHPDTLDSEKAMQLVDSITNNLITYNFIFE